MPPRHSVETAQLSLKNKNLDGFLTVESVDDNSALIVDKDYGKYRIDIKSLSPKSSVAMHKSRRHANRVAAFRAKYVGQKLNGLEILDVFYGPDKGYKNRSFYIEYKGVCGHSGINTYAVLAYHKKNFSCLSCSKTQHGVRTKIDGMLKKRTGAYNHWAAVRKTLPEKYQDFLVFKNELGDKPFKKASVELIDGKLVWVSLSIVEDVEINLMATALRQAFRNSSVYKAAIEASRVETIEGSRYRCAACMLLFKRADVEVDHIVPIVDTSGVNLTKAQLIDRVWTDKIQVLHKKCHSEKSTIENRIRRSAQKEKSKK